MVTIAIFIVGSITIHLFTILILENLITEQDDATLQDHTRKLSNESTNENPLMVDIPQRWFFKDLP